MTADAGTTPSLEQAIARLDAIAHRLEGGDIELAESLALYEEGIQLLRTCESLLSTAAERVEQLRAHGEGFRFDPVARRE